jgi:hypothetical protein
VLPRLSISVEAGGWQKAPASSAAPKLISADRQRNQANLVGWTRGLGLAGGNVANPDADRGERNVKLGSNSAKRKAPGAQ